jgi:hypothetical protein
MVPTNPSLYSSFVIGKIMPSSLEKISEKTILKTPFYKYTDEHIIATDEQLRNQAYYTDWDNDFETYRNIQGLHQIIQELQSNGIKIVIFTTPLHQYYIDSLSSFQKNRFSSLLDDLTEKYELEIYEFEEKYTKLNIWWDASHISTNPEVIEFNKDVAKMIISEIKK